MAAHDDYRHAAFLHEYGTIGKPAGWGDKRAMNALAPQQGGEWDAPKAQPDLESIRDLASEARHGGRQLVMQPTMSAADARFWARTLASGETRWDDLRMTITFAPDYRELVPEAAFDWPIYRAAMQHRASIRPCATLDCSGGAMGGSRYCADCNARAMLDHLRDLGYRS